jgi:hypothetical protein
LHFAKKLEIIMLTTVQKLKAGWIHGAQGSALSNPGVGIGHGVVGTGPGSERPHLGRAGQYPRRL